MSGICLPFLVTMVVAESENLLLSEKGMYCISLSSHFPLISVAKSPV